MTAQPLVLVVDDDEVARRLIVAALERDGFQVAEASDRASALSILRGDAPAIVVVDMDIHCEGGEAIMELLREGGDRTPAILMTGHLTDLRREVAERAAGIFEQPVAAEKLVATVAEALADYCTGQALLDTKSQPTEEEARTDRALRRIRRYNAAHPDEPMMG